MNQASNEVKNIMRKTGTTTLAIVCADGLVVAADKRGTYSSGIIVERDADKVHPIVDNIVVTGAGMSSAIDRVIKVARAELKLLEVRTNRKVTVKDAANLFMNMNYTNIRNYGEWELTHFLVAGKDIHGFRLFEAGADGTLKEHMTFAATGSGSIFAWPILESRFKKGMSTQEAMKIAAEAINQAQLRDTSSGSGFDIFTITEAGIKKVVSKDITPKAEL